MVGPMLLHDGSSCHDFFFSIVETVIGSDYELGMRILFLEGRMKRLLEKHYTLFFPNALHHMCTKHLHDSISV